MMEKSRKEAGIDELDLDGFIEFAKNKDIYLLISFRQLFNIIRFGACQLFF